MTVAAPARSKWRCPRSARLSRSSTGASSDGGDADRDVDEEDPRPAQVARQQAAEQHADGGAATRGCAVDAEREVALAALGEGGDEERERGRREQRSAEALEGAERDQRASDQASPQSSELAAKTSEADDEEAAAPDEVGEPAAEQERTAEEDGVGRDDPLQARRPRIRGRT